MFLSLILGLGATVGALLLVVQPVLPAGRVTRVESRDVLAPALALLALLFGEATLALTGGADRVTTGLAVVAVLSPLWALACGLASGSWLLRPHGFRDPWDRRLPRGHRAVLVFLTLTALLPLGGLAMPLWVLARQTLQPWRSEDPFPTDVVAEGEAVVA